MAALQAASVVRDRPRIGHLLMRLMETRAPLTIIFANSPHPSTTLLLHLDMKDGSMLLDEPYPSRPAGPIRNARLRGRVAGTLLEFDIPALGAVPLQGANALKAVMPSQVNHSERRGDFRVQIPSDLFLPPTTFTSSDGAFRGRLLDVSVSGVGSMVNFPGLATVGRVLACVLSLPGTRLLAEAEVCSVGSDQGARRLGLRFANLNVAQQTAMTRAIASLDRQLLRRYASAAWV